MSQTQAETVQVGGAEWRLDKKQSSVHAHVLRGQCHHPVTEILPDDQEYERRCENAAAARVVAEGGEIANLCIAHIPTTHRDVRFGEIAPGEVDVLDDADDPLQFFRLSQDCEKPIQSRRMASGDAAGLAGPVGSGGGGALQFSLDPSGNRCGDRAFLMLMQDDGTANCYCRRHARQMWLDWVLVEENIRVEA